MRDLSESEKVLLQERNALWAAFVSSPSGLRVHALESAYLALTGVKMPPADEQGSNASAANETAAGLDGDQLSTPPGATVKSLVLDMFQRCPERSFDFDSMIEYFEDAGIRLPAKDARDALRTAVANYYKDGLVERVGRGTYSLASPDSERSDVVPARPSEVMLQSLPMSETSYLLGPLAENGGDAP